MKTKRLRIPTAAAPSVGPASAATVADPVAQPLGPATISGTTITVDWLVNNPTVIPGQIRALVASNRGYFADRIFSSPGFRVQGGIVIAEPTKPNELFLPTSQDLAPRAPGAEAPRVGATRGEPVAYYPESISGSLEITDEAKERNQMSTITRQMRQIANTFTNRVQLRAIEVLKAWTEAEAEARTKANKTNWGASGESEDAKVKASEMPMVDFDYVDQLFAEDEAGEELRTVILNPADRFRLGVAYSRVPGLLESLLRERNVEIYTSPRISAGEGYFLSGPIGDLLWELPLTEETERIARRKITESILEMRPVFAPLDYLTVWRLTGLNS